MPFGPGWAGSQMAQPFHRGDALRMSLDPRELPHDLMRTTLCVFIALAASLLFACAFAVLAAKYRAAERVLRTAIEWARYGEVFEYDLRTGLVHLPEGEATPGQGEGDG